MSETLKQEKEKKQRGIKSVLNSLVMWFWPVKEPVKAPVKAPIAGEEWWLKNDSPWPKKDQKPVKILDVKDGWVRYDMLSVFRDERMELGSFLHCYRFHVDT